MLAYKGLSRKLFHFVPCSTSDFKRCIRICRGTFEQFSTFLSLATWDDQSRMISRQNYPKRTHILPIPSKPYSVYSVHSAIGSRMNGIAFRSFRKRNRSQKNAIAVYSKYSYSGIVPKECALANTVFTLDRNMISLITNETCFAMKSVHIRRCVARIMIETCLF